MSDTIDNKHPQYPTWSCEWEKCRDVWVGERAVKARDQGQRYLPPTSGHLLDSGIDPKAPFKLSVVPGTKGGADYKQYLARAVLHQFYGDCVDMMMGLLWNEPPPEIKLPAKMAYLKERAGAEGESLQQLWRNINQTQLAIGRMGLLPDFNANEKKGAPTPYICTYNAESIINWRTAFPGAQDSHQLQLVVMDESGDDVKPGTIFDWEYKSQYRVLMMDQGVYKVGRFAQEGRAAPTFNMSVLEAPNAQGKTLSYLPFTFVSCFDTTPTIVSPPLLDLADLSLGIYRLEADYRYALYRQTLATLFTKGFNWNDVYKGPVRIGGHIHAPNPEADAMYIEVDGKGIPELRAALENDRRKAAARAGEIIDTSSKEKQSGEALSLQLGTRTATLKDIAMAGAEALQKQLTAIAEWLGVSDKIEVIPNLNFVSKEFDAASFKALVESKMTLKGPLTLESIHKWSAERGGPGAGLTWPEMQAALKKEQALMEELSPTPPDAIAVEEAKAELNPKPPPAAPGKKGPK